MVQIKKIVKRAALSTFPETSPESCLDQVTPVIECQARELGLDRLARESRGLPEAQSPTGPFAGMTLDYELFPVHARRSFSAHMSKNFIALLKELFSLHPKIRPECRLCRGISTRLVWRSGW